jgi:predicted RNA binding protein YcfA (HicA-like mRNA interferase family)
VSPKLPSLTGKEIARLALRLGFEFRRQTGSHVIYVRPTDHARVVIPMHSGVAIKRKTLRGIIGDLKLTVEAFGKLLQD